MTIQNLIKELNQIIPFQQAEDFDNVGLLCGNPEREITGVLICHDALESVVEEAVQKNANVILQPLFRCESQNLQRIRFRPA